MITHDGHIKLTDFGLAKKIPEKTYTVCGTSGYLAPEIIMGLGHDHGVDWWALGILMFEMLTGYLPFQDENPMDLYLKIAKDPIDFPDNISILAKSLLSSLL